MTAWAIDQAQLVMYREQDELGIFAYRFADEVSARDAAVRLLGKRERRREHNRVFLAEDAVVWFWDDGVSDAAARVFEDHVRSAFTDS